MILEAIWTTVRGLFSEAIGPAFGALFGAYSAFKLERWRDDRREKRGRSEAVRRCQAALRYYQRTLTVLLDQHLSPLKSDENRWRKLSALAGPAPSLEVEPGALMFLVDLKKEDVLSKVVDCHSAYASVLTAVAERREAQERFWFALSRVPAEAREALMTMDPERLDAAIGPTVTGPLKSLTNALYQLVPETLARITDTDSALEGVADDNRRLDRKRWLQLGGRKGDRKV